MWAEIEGSSKRVFLGNCILFALEQAGNFPSVRLEWQVEQIHSVLSTLFEPELIHSSNKLCKHLPLYLLLLHLETDDQICTITNHNKCIYIQGHVFSYREKNESLLTWNV